VRFNTKGSGVHHLLSRLGWVAASVGVLALAASCGGSDLTLPSEFSPAAISKEEGDGQTGAAGAALSDSLGVKVVDRQGVGVPNAPVAFTIDGELPGAAVTPDVARTGSDGMARARWTLGAVSGTQAVIAEVVGADGLSVRFEAEVGSGDAANIAVADGNNQTGAVGTELANPLVVLVTDQFGNPVTNVRVDWDADDGSVDPSSSETGDDGRASASWVLGSSTGPQTATASSADLNGSPVSFTATAGAGSADELVRVSGNNQSGRAGQKLDEPLVVRLVDRLGNGISGRPVSWVIGAGGGTIPSLSTTTGGNGQAQTSWTLGPNPGVNTLTAVVSGVGVVTFSATATMSGGGGGGGGGGGSSDPSQLKFRVQPSDAQRDKKISPPVQVEVLDRDGNRVTDETLEIKLELLGDRGELKGDDDHHTQSGVATFGDLKVDEEGTYRLRASADGLPSVTSDQFRISHRGDHDDD
jgi:hypothetical protein